MGKIYDNQIKWVIIITKNRDDPPNGQDLWYSMYSPKWVRSDMNRNITHFSHDFIFYPLLSKIEMGKI